MSDMYSVPGSEGVTPAVDLKPPKVELPKVSDDKSYGSVKAGTQYLDPEGKTRYKPISGAADYAAIEEGEQYADPEGQIRTKPKFEGIDFTAQTLYDMSVTPSEKKKALERSYPGKVKEDTEGLYVEDNGKFRRPGRGTSSATGFIASAAAPTAGAVVGALGGGAAGGFVGGAVGGAGGAMLGQTFNDTILGLAGVYDRSPVQQAAATGEAGMGGMMGAGFGRGVATMVPAAKTGISSVGAALPNAVAKFLGANAGDVRTARELAEKGVMVPPSAWAHESPHLQNLVEVFDPAFRTNKPLQESAVEHYERGARQVLDDLGVQRAEPVSSPTAAVSTQAAGEKVLQKTLAESAQADAALKDAMAQRAAELQSGLPEQVAQRESLAQAAEQSRAAAQKLIDHAFEDIEKDISKGFEVAKAGGPAGDLWKNIGDKFTAVRRGISERARYWYDRYDEMTGSAKVSSEELSSSAQQMLDELPAEFKARNPALVQKLAQLTKEVPVEGAAEGIVEKQTTELTYGQLHDLRSLFRGSADWQTLSSDFKNGALKRFSSEIDALIHDPAAPPQVRSAAKFLDMVDKWYGHNVSVFEAAQIKAVMKGLEAGEPADAGNLYRAIVKEGHSDLTARIKEMVGPNLWAGVKAADTQAMLDASKTLEPGVIDAKKFAREVLERHRANMLDVVHGKDAEKLLEQARAIERLGGRLPIPTKPGDTMTQVLARARLAADEAKAAAAKDPLGTLNKEMKKIQAEQSRQAAKLKAERRNDPLGFLYESTTGANEAVDKILGSEDLILAASARFGDKSPEFNMLRQVYVQRILEGTLSPGARLEKIAPEVQQLMFPGATLKQMQTLAKEMEFLTTRRGLGKTTAGSMSAMSKVENPLTGMPVLKAAAKLVPGLNPAARAIRGKLYALITQLATSPTTLRWIEKGLTQGTPEEQEAIRNILRAHLQRGAAMGAGAGEAVEQGGMPQ